MRFTITRLGGAGRSVDRIVAAIVDYLRPRSEPSPEPAVEPPLGGGVDGPARHYTDGGEEPGRWRGRGATATGLVGDVDMADFAQVLAGGTRGPGSDWSPPGDRPGVVPGWASASTPEPGRVAQPSTTPQTRRRS